ncbi:MAG: hypothetical protein E4H03_01845 [Myxococcales bacterium]|jgi:DNA-nicking Smr family endonuclease|nr:MAG: hypothetical protein E4H03_01845 [Myxococcales bacterium]
MSRSSSDNGRDDRPFNNPFRDQLGKLKRGARRRACVEAPETAARLDVTNVTQPDDDTTFRQAMGGVVPLEGTGRVTGGSLAAPIVVHSAIAEDPTADEHFDVRFSDRFIRGRAAGVSRETIAKLEHGEFAVRSHVDLHGMPLDDAKVAVDQLISRCQRRGDRCVLVITGKGNNSPRQFGVLRERIPEWLACGPSSRCILGFVTARPCDGGEGALYVLLRRHAARKNRIDVEAGGGA